MIHAEELVYGSMQHIQFVWKPRTTHLEDGNTIQLQIPFN